MNDNSTTALLDAPLVHEPICELEQGLSPAVVSQPEPFWIRRGQIPGLDGLRAVAVLLVLASHVFQTKGFPDWPLLKQFFHQGIIGVDIFFVISGFLITTLLVRELERDGNIGLRRFYLRRFLRIMPAYLGLLAVVAVGQRIGYFELKTRDWVGAATYTSNFLDDPSWELGHTWSLSVEEHFYLLWPFVLYAGGVAAGWRAGLACLAGCLSIRCAIALGVPRMLFAADSVWADVSLCAKMAEKWTFTRLDTITMGSLLALACRSPQGRQWLNRLTDPKLLWIYFATFCVSLGMTRSSKFTLCIAYTLNAACIALLIWGLIRSQGIAKKVLGNRLLTTIGIGSYSIYLWQQLIIYPRHAGWIHQFPQNLFLVLGAACLSYWLIERPMNHFKDQVTR